MIIIYYLQSFLWLHFIEYIFFIWIHGGEELVLFLNELNNFPLTYVLHMKPQKPTLFFRFNCELKEMLGFIKTFILNRQIVHNTSIISYSIPNILKCQYHTVNF